MKQTRLLIIIGVFSALARGFASAAVPPTPSAAPPPPGTAVPAPSAVPLADPFILLHEGVYYAYGTGHNRGFPVYVSRDLVTWEKSPALALDMDDSFGKKWFWAPEVAYRKENKTFYMHYTAEERLCVATAKSPLGPFKQETKQPMRGERDIDSTLFVDDDGTPWLFFVRVANGQNIIWVAGLEQDWMTFKAGEPARRCLGPEQDWETIDGRVTEGPSVFKHNGVYYLVYSANGYTSPDYAIGYATAASPRGPWKKANTNPILKKPRPGLVGTGHGALFFDKNGRLNYVFHAHASPHAIHPRKMYIARVSIDKNGSLSIDKTSLVTPRPAAGRSRSLRRRGLGRKINAAQKCVRAGFCGLAARGTEK